MKKEVLPTEDVLNQLHQKYSRRKLWINISLITALVIVIGFFIILFLYFSSPEKIIGLGVDIESILISEDGNTTYIKLKGGSLVNITKIKFTFSLGGNDYFYETQEGIEEIAVPYKESFIDWLLRRQLEGVYDYRINLTSVFGLGSFQDIDRVDVIFEYVTGNGTVSDSPVLDTQILSSSGGGGSTTPAPSCIDTCNSLGYQCGIQSICGANVDCGGCGAGAFCLNGNCIVYGNFTGCQKLNQSNYYILNQNIINNSLVTTCIDIAAPNITLDCQGHYIQSNNEVFGIYSNSSNTIIKNCNVSVANTGSNGRGIFLNKANNSHVFNNILNDQYYGLYLRESFNTIIEKNIINGNSDTGIYLAISSGNFLIGNLITNHSGTPDKGIYLDANSHGNNLTNNTVINNYLGIFINSDLNVLNENIINNNFFKGVYLSWAQFNIMTNNIINNNNGGASSMGVSLSYSDNNVLINNTVNNNSDGIHFLSSSNNNLTNNTVNNNSQQGIDVFGNDNSNNNFIENKFCSNFQDVFCSLDQIFTNNKCNSGDVCGGSCRACSGTCFDSDNGLDYFVNGTCDNSIDIFTDNCVGDDITEFECSNNVCSGVSYTCLDGCFEGACVNVSNSCADGTIDKNCSGINSQLYCDAGDLVFDVTRCGADAGKCCQSAKNPALYAIYLAVNIPYSEDCNLAYTSFDNESIGYWWFNTSFSQAPGIARVIGGYPTNIRCIVSPSFIVNSNYGIRKKPNACISVPFGNTSVPDKQSQVAILDWPYFSNSFCFYNGTGMELRNPVYINCGNYINESGEVCDGIDVGAESCQSQGYESGTLGCLSDCSAFDYNSCVAYQATINLNSSITYQTMSGWETVSLALSDMPTSFPLFSNYSGRFYDVVVEVGINRIRLETHQEFDHVESVNDDNDPFNINWSGFNFTDFDAVVNLSITPLQNKLQAKGEKLYVNLNTVGVGGNITDPFHKDPDEFAEFVLAHFLHLQSKYGWVPDFVEVSLEPTWFETFDSDPIKLGQALIAMSERLEQNGFNPGIIAPSSISMPIAISWFDQMITIPNITDYWTEYSYHRYSGFTDANLQDIASRAATYGLNTSMLEWENDSSNYQVLHKDLKMGNNSAWQRATLGGIVDVNESDPNNITVILKDDHKFIRQYYKFVREGAVRIEATSQDSNFDALGFINQGGDYVVVVKANNSGSFNVGGFPAGTYGIKYTTSITNWDIDLADITLVPGEILDTSIPAAGVITIYEKVGLPSSNPLVQLWNWVKRLLSK